MATLTEKPFSPGVSEVLQPVFTLWYQQKDITNDIAPYVTSVTYTDSIKNESDAIEVRLDDTDGRWLDKWYPGTGDTLSLKLGYRGETLFNCGTFSIDEIEVSAPPSEVAIRGVATSVNRALRTKSNRGFEDTTLAAIAMRIAKKHQLTLAGTIQSIKIDRVTQYAETDVAFLKRLASEYGYAVKVVSDQLIFSHLATLRTQEPVRQIKPTDVARFSLRDTISHVYKNAKTKYQKGSEKKLMVYEANGGVKNEMKSAGAATSADTLKVNTRAADVSGVRMKTDAALDAHNEKQQAGSMTLMGSPQLAAGNKIELVAFGQLSGHWLINSARHVLERGSGYTTEVELTRGPATAGKRKSDSGKTLVTYHPDGNAIARKVNSNKEKVE
ncbi:phage protein D [Pectobacterium parmentieri]|uniref:phage late control D family protein n=1 Tax=Pectobacterium parmentieri TaxID=1905730 RepID=UPI000EADACED|nr:contractile injection system protein, VgrG/Pvc8 family [Pectobacterium parmentieri]AYH02059.1 phage protein D [Pectobacterium parmentieri]AYH28326.1 phage protein D [Pectobacterium parmentieri]AYH32632.1 phage protein D [Pectobacterium parmentieri]MBI0517224.1 phage protein D [Pectobacterium parmentieri]